MRRRRSGIGAELVPLVLILACLAGSLALIVVVHRRATSRRPARLAVAVAPPPSPAPPEPVPIVVRPEPEEPGPPPPPTPEDPTPKVLAKLTSAEAEQLLEASRADRKAAALEAARKTALAESERWRRRESLVRLQLDSLDSKVRKLENEVDELALERDALEKERDARKAMASQARSRPSQAILPHRGQNGTWRRPIVVECSNGMAILRPQGIGFGLFELASGFGPASNPFVATVAREAIRIQGNSSPDGQPVTPYIFFLVRPDGIRAYYEARGRLEPLGITFGYELADQEWEVDFPDLDDIKTWDGSAPSRPDGPDPLARAPGRAGGGGSPAEDEDFPSWGSPRRGGSGGPGEGPGGEFTWPPRSRALGGGSGRVDLGGMGGSSGPVSNLGGNPLGDRQAGPSGIPDGVDPLGDGPAANGTGRVSGGLPESRGVGPGSGTGLGGGTGDLPPSAAPRELSLGNRAVAPLGRSAPPLDFGNLNPPKRPTGTSAIGGTAPTASRAGGRRQGNLAGGPAAPSGSGLSGSADRPPVAPPAVADASAGAGDRENPSHSQAKDDPANAFVWPTQPGAGPRVRSSDRSGRPAGDGPDSVDRSPPVRHVGPFSKPLAMGLEPAATSNASGPSNPPIDGDPTQPDGSGNAAPGSPGRPQGGTSGGTTRAQGQPGSPSDARGIGQGGTPASQPPPGSIGVGMPGMSGMPPAGMPPPGSPPSDPPKGSTRSPSLPEPSPTSVVDRRFEVVVVCGPRGVIVQPGGYRVTADALKDRDGLLKKQMVALVKARRTADPKTIIEPRVRFLVQPGGDKMYWAARSQFLLSGLDWPVSTQVSDPDHPTFLPSESW